MEALRVADENDGQLSEWLELMLAEIARRQEDAQAGDIEQAARALQPSQRSASDEPQMAASQPTASARTRTPHRARSA
jgi:hypothetical protein